MWVCKTFQTMSISVVLEYSAHATRYLPLLLERLETFKPRASNLRTFVCAIHAYFCIRETTFIEVHAEIELANVGV